MTFWTGCAGAEELWFAFRHLGAIVILLTGYFVARQVESGSTQLKRLDFNRGPKPVPARGRRPDRRRLDPCTPSQADLAGHADRDPPRVRASDSRASLDVRHHDLVRARSLPPS